MHVPILLNPTGKETAGLTMSISRQNISLGQSGGVYVNESGMVVGILCRTSPDPDQR